MSPQVFLFIFSSPVTMNGYENTAKCIKAVVCDMNYITLTSRDYLPPLSQSSDRT